MNRCRSTSPISEIRSEEEPIGKCANRKQRAPNVQQYSQEIQGTDAAEYAAESAYSENGEEFKAQENGMFNYASAPSSQPIFPFSKIFEDEKKCNESAIREVSVNDIPKMSYQLRQKLERAKRREEVILATLRSRSTEDTEYSAADITDKDMPAQALIEEEMGDKFSTKDRKSKRNGSKKQRKASESLLQSLPKVTKYRGKSEKSRKNLYKNESLQNDSESMNISNLYSEEKSMMSYVDDEEETYDYRYDETYQKGFKFPKKPLSLSEMALSLGENVERVIEKGINTVTRQ